MIRVAIHARHSSDHQSEASIEDQVRLCRKLIALYDAANPKRRFGPELRKGRKRFATPSSVRSSPCPSSSVGR